MAKVDKQEEVSNLCQSLFSLMGVKTQAEVTFDKDNNTYLVALPKSEESGLLIGKRGETISSLQTLLGVMLQIGTGEWSRIIVNVGDWREKQEDYLKNLADNIAQKVKESDQEQPIYNLNPGQRRIIHLELSQDPELETESFGEGTDRYLVVRLKKK